MLWFRIVCVFHERYANKTQNPRVWWKNAPIPKGQRTLALFQENLQGSLIDAGLQLPQEDLQRIRRGCQGHVKTWAEFWGRRPVLSLQSERLWHDTYHKAKQTTIISRIHVVRDLMSYSKGMRTTTIPINSPSAKHHATKMHPPHAHHRVHTENM